MTYYPYDTLHAYHNGGGYWKSPMGAPPAAAAVDHTTGVPAPSLAWSTANADDSGNVWSMVTASPPLSMRLYVKHPRVSTTRFQIARFLGCIVYVKVRSDGLHGYEIDVNGKGVVGSFTVDPDLWARFEFNATNTTTVRVRAWQVAPNATETPLFDYSTTTMTARSGGNIGPYSGTGTPPDAAVGYDEVVVVPQQGDIGPADYLPPRVSAIEGGSRVDVATSGVVTGGVATGLRLAGIYEARGGDRVYYDVAPIIAGIDAATTMSAVKTALAPLLSQSKVTLYVHESDYAYSSTNVTAIQFSNPRLKPFMRYLARSLAQLPPSAIARGVVTEIHVGRTLFLNDSPVSGVAYIGRAFMAVEQTQFHFDTVGSADDRAHPGVVMHELAHVLELSAGSGSTALAAMDAEFVAANPPGFTYMGVDAQTAPFEGDHPEGFIRSYSRANRLEDYADVFMAMTVPAMYPDLRAWMRTDPYLRAKVNAVKKFVKARWLIDYAFEEMHASYPQVLPL